MLVEDNEVDLKVKFKFLVLEIFLLQVHGNKLVEGGKEILFVSNIKIMLDLAQKYLRCWSWLGLLAPR